MINNETKVPKEEITEERLRESINEYLEEEKNTENSIENIPEKDQRICVNIVWFVDYVSN